MSNYRPLSKVGEHDPDLDTLHEEIQPWMVPSLTDWLDVFTTLPMVAGPTRVNVDFLKRLERALRVRPALDWQSEFHANSDLRRRIAKIGPFGMDAIGFAVSLIPANSGASVIDDLNEILTESGSAWEATPGDESYRLTRRDMRAAKDAITAVKPLSERAYGLLVDAWAEVATRNPDPNGGYDKAVKAIEAAAQPVVQPKHAKATLGTILGELKANKALWTFELGDVDLVVAIAERVWTSHIRHGTDTRTDHTIGEADAALHCAIPLVRFFVGGLIHRR